MGTQGYDMEEIPTGAFKGYCVQLPYDQQNGLCQGYKGTPKVCSVSEDGEGNPLAAINWLEEEVFSRRAPHTDKSLERGGQSFEFLQIFLNNWVCKQVGENYRVRTILTDDEKQEAACKYIWRRDQEIQNGSLPNGAVPSEGDLWGTFTYKVCMCINACVCVSIIGMRAVMHACMSGSLDARMHG